MNTPSMYAAFEMDQSAEEEGVWVTFGPVEMKLRSLRCKAAYAIVQAQVKRQRHLYMGGSMPPLEVTQMNDIELLSKALVADWKGVTDRAGNTLACTAENIAQVMRDLPVLRERVMRVVGEDETFRRASLETIRGN